MDVIGGDVIDGGPDIVMTNATYLMPEQVVSRPHCWFCLFLPFDDLMQNIIMLNSSMAAILVGTWHRSVSCNSRKYWISPRI